MAEVHSALRAWQLLIPLCLVPAAGASVADVLPDHDNGPLTGIFGFPESTEGSAVVGDGHQDWGASLISASHDIEEIGAAENLRLDGESTRLAFNYRYGLSDNFEIGIEIPYLWHESGNLDSAIDGWHDLFGLPEGARSRRQQDQLEFFYADSAGTLINLTNSVNGIGDIRVVAGWRLAGSSDHSTALRFGIKIPSGDSDELLGSGGTDVSLGVAGDAHGLWGSQKLSGFYRANVSYLGEPDRLADRYNDFVGQVAFGLSYPVHQTVDLKLQSRFRSAVYDVDSDYLGATSVALIFGADFRVSNRYRLVLSVGEDIRPDSAPDVSFQIALRYVGH